MSTPGRVVLLFTSPRVAVGLLTADAWAALHAGPVFADVTASDGLSPLTAAGVQVQPVPRGEPVTTTVDRLLTAARDRGTATWWVGRDDACEVVATLRAELGTGPTAALDELHGSWDLPGARLLDVVATMDRLRSPGGCPWDAKQDHASLAPYLLEEAYEAFQTIEDGDVAGLRGELGDVLLQVAFHARLATELPAGERWTIDDVATGLVDKLVRRHPHVFGDVSVADADEVNANWEMIKAAERGDASVLANVPLAAAALTLATTLQRKATRVGVTDLGVSPIVEAVAAFQRAPSAVSAGEVLWSAVAAMREAGIDAEAALRARSRTFRDGH